MALRTEDKEDQSLNPSEQHARGLSNYESRALEDIENNFDENSDPSQEDDNIDKARQQLQDREESPKTPSVKNPMNYTPGGEKQSKVSGKVSLRRRSPLIALIALLGGGGFSVFMFTGFLAPIAFFENIVDDLNDQLAAMDIRSTHIFRHRVSISDRSEAVKGCTKLSIRCKFATMSAKQVAKLERAGIRVVPDKSVASIRQLNGRVVPKEFQFRDKTYTPRQFAEALGRNGDTNLKISFKRGLNMKYLGVSDKTFVGRTLKRFGVSRKPPELRGSHQDRVNALMTKGGVGSIDDLRFVSFETDEGETKWRLEGRPDTEYTDAEKTRMERSIDRVKRAQTPSRTKANAIKGIGVLGAIDLACSVKNMIGAAAVAAKVANAYQMVEYAMPLASMAGSMKAGDISAEDSAALQEMFNQTDNREYIPDIMNAFQQSGGEVREKFEFVDGDIPMMENPNYGKSMMDSELYKLSSTGQLGPMSPELTAFSLGMGQNRLLRNVSSAASFMNSFDIGQCDVVQNWFVRGASMVAGIALGIASGGASLAIQGGIFAGLFIASMQIEAMLNNALSNNITGDDIDEAPSDRSAIAWGGMSELLGKTAQARGLIPGNAEQVVHYQNLNQEVMADYTAIAREDADPFDIYDQHSFLGSFARSIGNKVGYSSHSSVRSAVTGAASLVGSTLPSLFSGHTSMAAPIDPARFKVCDDEGYSDMGIDADVQCNIRYFMPTSDLALDVEDVNDYMESNGYVEIDEEIGESITGLPEGYTPPDPVEAHNFAMGLIDGIVGSFYNDRDKYGEYGRFLDYCAYRALPFGETYEERGAFGAAKEEWVTGEKCMEDSEMLANFRIYTLDKTVQEAQDSEEAIELPSEVTVDTPTFSGELSQNWSSPIPEGVNYGATSGYGVVRGGQGSEPHQGTDFGYRGADFLSVCDGEITRIDNKGEYRTPGDWTMSNRLTVYCGRDSNGEDIYARYHHYYFRTVKPGLRVGSGVRAGQPLAQVGNQGNTIGATGYHLHFEIRTADNDGFRYTKDPVEFLRNRGINL